MKEIMEIRWHGRGGQGAKTAALALAESALREGKYIQGFPEYGPERMGAPIQAFTRISDRPITIHSHVTNPDAVVVLDATLLEMVDVTVGMSPEGSILVNSPKSPQEIRERLNLNTGKVFTVDATSISLATLGRNFPNTPMLGALIKATGILDINSVITDVREKFGKKFTQKIVEGNVEAIKRAYEEVRSG